MNPSDEIKSRLDIVETIRDYIPLKQAGMNFRANCPFHNEKTPSFMVSREKQIWHCFGCQKGGSIIDFVMEMEGVSFVEALKILAPKAGIKLERQDPKMASRRNRLLDILELSNKYYHKVLIDSKPAQAARDYLKKRGLSDETIEEWRIGCSPDSWDDLINFLKSKGYKDDEIFASGMSVKKEGTNRFYNRFRGRIMFPIFDTNGNAVAFSARVSPEKEATEKMGKYINSPQTMIYDKSKILFGLDKAKMAIKKQDLAIIVEGQMDVITAHQAGFKNVIASSGTALTAEQVALIKRYTQNIALAFDMDQAGAMAVDRGMAQAMQAEMNISVVQIPTGKDPDECIKNNPDEWRAAVESAKPVMQHYFDKIFAGLDMQKVQDRKKAAKTLLPVVAKLNKIEQEFWLKKLSQKIDVAETFLREALDNASKQAQHSIRNQQPKQTQISQSAKQGREELMSELLLALLVKFPIYIKHASDFVGPDYFTDAAPRGIYKDLIMYYNKITNSENNGSDNALRMDYQNIRDWLKNEAQIEDIAGRLKILDRLALLADKDFYEYDQNSARVEIINIINFLKKNYLSKKLKELSKLIMQAEQDDNQDKDLMNGLMEEFKSLTQELAEIES